MCYAIDCAWCTWVQLELSVVDTLWGDLIHPSATAKEGHSVKLLFKARLIIPVCLQARCLQYRIIPLNVGYLKKVFKATYPCQR